MGTVWAIKAHAKLRISNFRFRNETLKACREEISVILIKVNVGNFILDALTHYLMHNCRLDQLLPPPSRIQTSSGGLQTSIFLFFRLYSRGIYKF
jgi:hypothetical protein